MRQTIFILTLFAVSACLAVGAYLPARYLPMEALGVQMETLNQPAIDSAAKVVFYDITGSTNTELNQAMEAQREIITGIATTTYVINYIIWVAQPNTAECQIKKWEVAADITVTMPRWTNPGDGSLELVLNWRTLFEQINDHEEKHVEIVLEGLDQVRAAIAGSTCANATQRAEDEINAIVERQTAYDVETGNAKP